MVASAEADDSGDGTATDVSSGGSPPSSDCTLPSCLERSPPIKGVTRQFREISTPTTGSGGGSTAVHMTNRSLRKLNPAYQHGTRAVPFAPGREGPAMADFFAEPLSLDFWKLRKSFVRTRSSALLICPRWIGILIKKVTGSVARPLSPSQRLCLIVTTLLLMPLARPLQWFRAEGKRCSSTPCACQSSGAMFFTRLLDTRPGVDTLDLSHPKYRAE